MAKQYANHKSHAIHAALMGYFHFATLDQAKLQLQILRDSYFISRHALHPDTPESTHIWVRGYELSEEDKKQGLLGHFVKITCHMESAGKWGFAIEKIVDDAPHPQRKRMAMQHPNWGHPVLRDVKKKKCYDSIEAAHAELIRLQQEYPKASVPGKYALFVAIYGHNADKPGSRIVRYVLEIEPQKEGGYLIVPKLKKQKLKVKSQTKLPKSKTSVKAKASVAKPKVPPARKAEEKPKKPMGFFTSKVILKRGDKKP